MKPPFLAVILVMALGVLLAGCKPKTTEPAEQATQVPQFSAKNGLLLPEETRQSLGLKIVEVSERSVSATLTLELRVYRADGGFLLASSAVTPAQAKLLVAGRRLEARASDGEQMTGAVSRVNVEFQKAIGASEVLVTIQDAPKTVAVGDFIHAVVKLDSEKRVVTIPQMALLRCSEGEFVYTVSGEHLVRTAVKVGARNEEWVEIKDGLYAGDQVALQPVMSLWMTELAAVKGGQACCVGVPKGK
jgi:hypothetical protein